MPLFRSSRTAPLPVDASTEDVAYREGRLDERRRVDPAVVEARSAPLSTDAAYEKGRLDERRRRRGSPLLSLLLAIVVVIGAVMIYLAIRNGSFGSGGAVVDRDLSSVADKARAPIAGAADKAGSALQNAGADLKQSAGSSKP